MEVFVITQGSGPLYQRGKHNVFVRRVLVRVGMEIEVVVYGFTVVSFPNEPWGLRYILISRKDRWVYLSVSIVD
jgi:hypothetical protein